MWQRAGYGLFLSAARFGWFVLVALFFSNSRLCTSMPRWQKALNRGIGSVLVGLGVTLGLSHWATPSQTRVSCCAPPAPTGPPTPAPPRSRPA
ncbi:hypothetical protein [Streptomyces sp. NPDC001880]